MGWVCVCVQGGEGYNNGNERKYMCNQQPDHKPEYY